MKKHKKHIEKLDLIIFGIFAGLIIFVVEMDRSFQKTGSEQAVLIGAVFGFCATELWFCWRIWSKKKNGKSMAQAIEEAVNETAGQKQEPEADPNIVDEEGGIEG